MINKKKYHVLFSMHVLSDENYKKMVADSGIKIFIKNNSFYKTDLDFKKDYNFNQLSCPVVRMDGTQEEVEIVLKKDLQRLINYLPDKNND